jgi:hypothetical protein
MKLYGELQAGGSLKAISPGERVVLFDGTEAPAAGVTSLAFVRAPGPAQTPARIVFSFHFGAVPDATVQIQGSNRDVDAEYQVLDSKAATQDWFYQDEGNFAYYRAKLSAYVGGGMPVVVAQR